MLSHSLEKCESRNAKLLGSLNVIKRRLMVQFVLASGLEL